jgi:endonuclease III
MDRQISAERAWLIPFTISQRHGSFIMQALSVLTREEVHRLMNDPEPVHRFPAEMSTNFHEAVQRISQVYQGDASKIWSGRPSSAEVVYRFLQFRGVGPKIGAMAANILARDFKIPFSDYFSIDLAVDVQVKRVFVRLGLVPSSDDNQAIIYKARALHPSFPGLFDFPAWEIGRKWCRPTNPLCNQCLMKDLCPSSTA